MSSVASSEDDRSSRSSFSTGGGSSVISDNSNAGALAAMGDRDDDDNVQDLLDQNKGIWDAAFACLLLLTKRRSVTSYRMLLGRMLFEYLQVFRLVFNTRFLWAINTNLWIWKCMYWVLFRFLLWDKGYDTYVKGLYGVCSVVLLLVGLTILIAVVLRKDDSTNWWFAKLIHLVQSVSVLVFSVAWVGVLDYMVFMFTCDWGAVVNHHLKWTSVQCAAMPHMGNMIFAGVTAVIFAAFVLCLAMAECKGDMLTSNLMAAPVVMTVFKTTALKVVMVLVSTCLDEFPKPQAVLMFLCPLLSTYFQASSSPYLLPWMNHIWTGLWASIAYTTSLLLALNFSGAADAHGLLPLHLRQHMTMAVLWGIFPALLAGMAVSWLVFKWRTKPLAAFKKTRQDVVAGRICLDSAAALRAVYRPHSVEQVEFLVRCVRQFDPVTEEVLPEAVALAGLVIQVGMAKFPNNAALLLLYADFIIFVKKEPRSARTQLQLAAKHEPGVVERFLIFAALDVLKNSHSSADSGLDLMAFVEFQRNYRACVKSHKVALMAQRAFWRSVMSDKLHMADLLISLSNMQAAEARAIYVYKRVLERYPQNGKLLKVWGRFQEWVLHDPARAARTYAEAVKRGLGDNLLNLSGSHEGAGDDDIDGQGKAAKVDEKVDGVIIIDARGIILLANKVVCKMFAYVAGELEGKNVSILMPQPFSSRHNRYMSNYVTSGVAKILDSDRHVVALRKDHTIFPLNLYVRKLSGSGPESIFIAAIRPAREDDPNVARVWTSSQGVVLCSDTKFCDWFGITPEHIANHPLSSLTTDPEAMDKFLSDCNTYTIAEAANRELCMKAFFHHRYLQTMEVALTVTFGGTDAERLTVVSMRSLTEAQRLIVVNGEGRILHATSSFAQMLGVHGASLHKANISSLIPAPLGHLHKPWIKETVPGAHARTGSCRSPGAVVQVLAGNGQKIPVKLNVQTVLNKHSEKVDHLHVVKFTKATAEELTDARRMRLIVDARGVVVEAPGSHPKNMFGFDAAKLVGRPLASFINVFEEFRVQQAMEQQQGSLAGAGATSRGVHGTSKGPEFSRVALQLRLDAADEGVDLTPGMLGSSSASRREIDPSSLDDSMLLSLLTQAAQEGSTASHRVGVLAKPLQDEQIGRARSNPGSGAGSTPGGLSLAQLTGGSFAGMLDSNNGGSILLAARGFKAASLIRPAILKVDVVTEEDDNEGIKTGELRILVELWRADLLSGVLEVDSDLKVVKADVPAGQLLGGPPSMLQTKQLKRVLTLPKHIASAVDMLANAPTGKASALKRTSLATVGPVIKATGVHADALPVELLLQGLPKEAHTTSRVLLHVKCSKPCTTGSLQAMLHLAGAANSSAAGGLPSLAGGKLLASLGVEPGSKSCRSPSFMADAVMGAPAGPKSGAGLLRESFEARQDEEVEPAAAAPGRKSGAGTAARGAKSGRGSKAEPARSLWQDGQAGGLDDGAADMQGPAASAGWGRGSRASAVGRRAVAGHQENDAGDWQPQAAGRVFAGSGSGAYLKGDEAFGEADEGPEEQDSEAAAPGRLGGQDCGRAGRGGGGGGAADGAEDGAAGSELGSDDDGERRVSSSSAGDGRAAEEEEDLTCDWRRAKRLRNLIRQLDSPVARKALTRFWGSTWLLSGIVALAHIVCFAVLVLVVNTRHRDVYGVQQMTYAVDKSQMILLRANMLSKCGFTGFEAFDICSKEQTNMYLDKQTANTADLNYYHKGLFLGFKQLEHMQDPKLYHYWTLPVHSEYVIYDTATPNTKQTNISLWNLGNRYIYAARESAYAYSAGATGPVLEADHDWQYIDTNGRDSLFQGYAVSLDMYVSFVWSELGSLGALLTALLVIEIVVLALVVMGLQMAVIRQMARQRMACFTVFLALPTATLRAMAVLPCQVDEDDAHDDDDDELVEAAAAAAGALSTADDSGGAGAASTADGTRKSVRMSVAGDGGSKAGAKDGKSGSSKLLSKKKGKGKSEKEELTGLRGWFQAKARAAKQAARGVMNRPLRVNGKRLAPARGVFARFMSALLLWWLLSFIIYGVSFKELADLQGPLTSLQAAAKVQYLISRTRVLANMIGFLPDKVDTPDRLELKGMLRQDLITLKSTYFTLLYGGEMDSLEPGARAIHAPAAVFHSTKTSNLFFKTQACLRKSKPCVARGTPWYDVSHTGLDTLMQRFLGDMDEFMNLPPAMQSVNASCYEFTWRIGANDLYEGLQTAGDLFVQTTLTALSQLSELHAILLALTIAILGVQVLMLLVPFRRQVLQESMRLAGLLSLLPQEADVDGHVRSLVLDVARGKPHGDGPTGWGFARGVTVAAAAARAAAARASGAVNNMRSRMAEASAANAAAAAAAGGGSWQPYEEQAESEASSAQDW